MSDNGSYFVREADLEADRESIQRIWAQKVTGTALTQDKLIWFYELNPAGKGRIFLLCRDDLAEPVGAVGVVPRKFMGNGVTLTGGLIIDFVVLPEHRTMGPGLMLQRAAIDAVSAHIDFTLSFPNRLSRILRERLGYDVGRTLDEFVCPIALDHYVSRRIPATIRRVFGRLNRAILGISWRLQASGSLVQIDYCPEFIDKLWRRMSSNPHPLGLRDPLTLEWRLQKHPFCGVEFFCIESENSGESGYIAYTVSEGRKVNIVDSLADNARFLRQMYARFLLKMAEENMVSVALRAEQGGLFDPKVHRLGFQKRDDKKVYLAGTGARSADTMLPAVAVSGFDGDS